MIGYNLPSISWFNVIETRFALTAALCLTINGQRYMNGLRVHNSTVSIHLSNTNHCLEANVSQLSLFVSIVNSKKKLVIKLSISTSSFQLTCYMSVTSHLIVCGFLASNTALHNTNNHCEPSTLSLRHSVVQLRTHCFSLLVYMFGSLITKVLKDVHILFHLQ
jgi:sRNA-binding regulator protein Hfq